MTPSLDGLPTKAKETSSPHEVRLAGWTSTQYFNVSGNVLVTCYLACSQLLLLYSWLAVSISLLAVALVKVFTGLSLTRFYLVYFSVNSSVIFI